jgi:hypothetical protein
VYNDLSGVCVPEADEANCFTEVHKLFGAKFSMQDPGSPNRTNKKDHKSIYRMNMGLTPTDQFCAVPTAKWVEMPKSMIFKVLSAQGQTLMVESQLSHSNVQVCNLLKHSWAARDNLWKMMEDDGS